MLGGIATAQENYHGFKPETVDALNERLKTPLTESDLEVLSHSTAIKPCGGEQPVVMSPPEGWEIRLEDAQTPNGSEAMPVPKMPLALKYPVVYEILGIEGVCQIMFDVTDAGETKDVQTNCTLPGFQAATLQVFKTLEFDPGEGQDSPAAEDILVPINFCRPDGEIADDA